jgi:hypothetical protein
MGRWPVTVSGQEAFVADSEGREVSLFMPSPTPVLVSTEDAEYIRQVIALAIADAQASPAQGVSDVDV